MKVQSGSNLQQLMQLTFNVENRQKKVAQQGAGTSDNVAQTPYQQPGTSSQPQTGQHTDQHHQPQQGAAASHQPHQQSGNVVSQQSVSSQARQPNPDVPQQQQQQQQGGAWRQSQQQAKNLTQQPQRSQPRQPNPYAPQQQQQQHPDGGRRQPQQTAGGSQPRQQQQRGGAWGQPRFQPVQPNVSQERAKPQPAQQQPAATESPRSQPETSQQKQQFTEKIAAVQDQIAKTTLKDSSFSAGTGEASKTPKDSAPIALLKIPERKKAGTLGRPIIVETNMLPIKFGKKFPSKVIHYDVKIDPQVPKYLLRPAFNKAIGELFPGRNPAFDGKKNAFSAGALFDEEEIITEVEVPNEDERKKKFKVALKKVKVLDLSWVRTENPFIEERNQTCIQALDIILRNASAANSRAIVGRSFFTLPKHPESLEGGMDLWTGLFQSAVCGSGPLLNIDVAHKGFPKPQSVIDLMKTLCGVNDTDSGGGDARGQQFGRGRGGYRGGGRGGYQDRGSPRPTELNMDLIHRYKDDITSYLKGLKIVYEIPNQPTSRRTWRVNDLLMKSPQQDFFIYRDPVTQREQNISIEFYYKNVKKYSIRNPHFPCLSVGPKEKNIHLPVEFCTIVEGQVTQKKLNERQTSKMIRFAATGTEERKKKIMDAFASMKHKEDPCMKEFDLSLGEQFEKVPARVLPTPTLVYQQNQGVNVSKGVWRAEGLKFYNPCTFLKDPNSWTILNLDNRTVDRSLYELKEKLQTQAQKVGIVMGEPETPFQSLRGNHVNDLTKYFEEKKRKNLQLIIVIIPEMKGPYSKVKQGSELNIGILTQCIVAKTLKKINTDPTVVANILLKINAKLNGTNHVFVAGNEDFNKPSCLTKPCMIVGADVTHPSPDTTDIPSIAAVTASHDPNAFRYKIEIRLQPARKEIILDLKEIMIIHLKSFQSINKVLPQKIIFFRDGVGEGEFNKVMSTEIIAIRDACKHLNKDYKPKITFLVVQKRHHVRLFPTVPANSDDWHRNKNVQAGTIVDTKITNPAYSNFYLVSHASIQGTARPTKYCCLWDDSNFSENDIEKLTYFLCHIYTRCNRSVSYPAPTYYAHLAAFRARALIQDKQINMEKLNDPVGRMEELINKMAIKDEILNGKSMFFV